MQHSPVKNTFTGEVWNFFPGPTQNGLENETIGLENETIWRSGISWVKNTFFVLFCMHIEIMLNLAIF